MATVAKLKELILPITQAENVILYDVEWVQDGKMRILQVSIMNQDGKMDIDTCAKISSLISDMLDEQDVIDFEYYLEVCSPGAERVLRSEAEVQEALDQYIYIKFKNPIALGHEVLGYLREINEEHLVVEYMAKNIKKKAEVNNDNIEFIRLAVKL